MVFIYCYIVLLMAMRFPPRFALRFGGVVSSHRLCFGCAPPTASICNGEAANSMNLFFPNCLNSVARQHHRQPCVLPQFVPHHPHKLLFFSRSEKTRIRENATTASAHLAIAARSKRGSISAIRFTGRCRFWQQIYEKKKILQVFWGFSSPTNP